MANSNLTSLIGSSYVVHVTHINNPHSFYVRRTAYDDMMKQLERLGPLLSQLTINREVVYHSETIQKYVRGKICSLPGDDDSRCDIFAMDYGCVDRYVPLGKIRIQANSHTPPLAEHCALDMCSPKDGATFSQDVIDVMKSCVGNEVAKITIKAIDCGDKLIVQLINSCPDDIATMLALMNYTSFFYTLPSGSTSSIKSTAVASSEYEFKPKAVKVGDILHVRVLSGDNVSKFYVAENNDFKEYFSDRNAFTDYCQIISAVNILKIGQSVGVFYNNTLKFERAIVKDITIPGTRALVELIDCGKEIEVCFNNIRPLKKIIYTLKPAIAIHCSADQSQIWDNRLQKFLYPGYEFKIKIVKVGENSQPNIVDLIRLNHQ